MPNRKGSIHLFRFAGINVYMHWSWFVVAYIQVQYRMQLPGRYSSLAWCIYEYLGLFIIVLLHEFGHSLACRSVGGRADQIVLWPLGGVAFVDPPPRPGATLWSIAAGPLVNLLLFPIFGMAWLFAKSANWPETKPNLYSLVLSILIIDIGLFCFNMLPIYPLDGGQILRSVLWYFLGRARSLLTASIIGLVAVVLLVVFAFVTGLAATLDFNTVWLLLMAFFVLLNCWGGVQQARGLARVAAAPRREGLACPHCKNPPPAGSFWICGRCRTAFDMFATRGVCPNCGTIFNETRCLECGEQSSLHSFGDLNS